MTETSARRGISGGQIALVVVGAIVALLGFAAMAGGSVLVWAHTTQRDADGYYTSNVERFVTPTYALTSRVDLGDTPGQHDWTFTHPVGTVRVEATSTEGRDLFVGIGPQAAVERWLAGVAHEEVTGANFGPFRSDQSAVAGDRRAAPPLGENFWVASVSGTGQQTLYWPSEQGRWTIVVMNTDATSGVTAAVTFGAKTGILLPIGLGLLGFAVLAFAGATTALFFGLRHQTRPHPDEPPVPVMPAAPGTYPARLDGHLDLPLSRWRWLVKWLLLIPHFVVLAFLWLAVVVLTTVAGFAILFTGRYPRSIFDFNLGIMRWTWRVMFYGLSGFATDKYPPFTLRSDPTFPADFNVEYPDHLSRGLVLVKWWLLAIPHYLVVAVFAGGWSAGRSDGWRVAGGGGLIALLVLIAGVVLLFRNRYPESIFDFVMGMNRWCFRVLAYAALMRDEYPPFRFDAGGLDPGSVPFVPPPEPPDQRGLLVDVDMSA